VKLLIAAAVLAASTPALAQPNGAPGNVTDIEVPTLVLDEGPDQNGQAADEAIDLANIVQSAAKGVTTVQEAPAIVTVITADEIRDRQFQDIEQVIDTVPGWQRSSIYYNTFPTPLVRGNVQAVQFLHDGLSLFDPFVNVPAATNVQPMELIKRIEMITGPGGVLWGSNSLLGILNIITKDAEDVDGIEVGGRLGDGRGDRSNARAYIMAGAPDLLGGKLKLFFHGSIDTYKGPLFEMPLLLYHSALPQPNSANIYGPLTDTDQPRSMFINLDGKISYENFQLRVFAPIGAKYNPMGLSGAPNRQTLPEDKNCMGVTMPTATCVDPLDLARKNEENVFDRYAVLEYRTRFAGDKAGITARVYGEQFIRGFEPLQVLAPSNLLPGGLAFNADLTSYRTGGAVDGDIELPQKIRVLYGAEAFYEWKPNNTTNALGTGTQSEITAPYDLNQVPLLCPRQFDPTTHTLVPVANCPLVFGYPADRTVLGAYVNPQWRPTKDLILDAGARLQVSPAALGILSYDPNLTVSAAAVWNFIPNWHLKVNYTQGFRPPVFNDTTSNGEGVQIGGNQNLTVETSDALQAELNARLYKGERRIRELSFRLDASYTRVNDLIQATAGQYVNSGNRGIPSIEFLGKLYVQGGHRIELGYTYLRVDTTDKGRLLALPENSFSLAEVFSILPSKLTATTTLKITGASEDPNRLVEYRGLMADSNGLVASPVTVNATDLVLDRLPPAAELSIGVRYQPTPKLAITGTIYDALAGHYYQPDPFFDYEPHLEYLPNPYEGFRAYVSAMYQY
jgi:outer membrane receptor protein involved in Fe transport